MPLNPRGTPVEPPQTAVPPKREVRIVPAHVRVIGHLGANGGNLPAAVRAAGYTGKHAATTIKTTKSWNKALDKILPEAHIARRHRELLDKRDTEVLTTRTMRLVADPTDDDPDHMRELVDSVETLVDVGPETAAVSKALEMAYKLRGRFVPEAPFVPPPVNYNLFYSPIVQQAVKQFENNLKTQIIHAATLPPAPVAAPQPNTPPHV